MNDKLLESGLQKHERIIAEVLSDDDLSRTEMIERLQLHANLMFGVIRIPNLSDRPRKQKRLTLIHSR